MASLAHGHDDTMADTTQKQTAAAESTSGQKPSGAGTKKSPASNREAQSNNLNLEDLLADELGGSDSDNEIDAELDPELAGMKSKTDKTKKASSPKEEPEEEPEAEESEEDDEAEEESEEESEETAEEEEETEETESEEAEIGDEDEVDPEKPPKGFENVPKGIWKRQNKLIKNQRELRTQLAQGAIKVTPTPASPLADVDDLETLNARTATAKSLLDWFKKNPQGGTFTLASGKTVEFDQADIEAQAAKAELIRDAAPDVKLKLMKREESKPWETAQKLEPKLFDKTSPEYKFMSDLLTEAPGLADHPHWEVIAAYAARGYREVTDENSKKARYVRYELDKDGKLIAPAKSKTGDGKQAAGKPAPKPAPKVPPVSPSAHKPAQKSTAKLPDKKRSDSASGNSDIAKMLADELGD